MRSRLKQSRTSILTIKVLHCYPEFRDWVFKIGAVLIIGESCTRRQGIAVTGELSLASKLTSEASSTRDQAHRFDSVFPNGTSVLSIGRGSFHAPLSPLYNLEKDAVRLNHFSGDGMREGVIWPVPELEESVRFAGLPKGPFECLLATERSDCFRN